MRLQNQTYPLIISLLFLLSGTALAQGQLADYQRSEALKTKLKDKVYNAPQQVNWTKSGNRCWYVVQTPRGKEFVVVDPKQKTRQLAFNHEQLAEKLSTATGKKIEPYNLPFTTLTFGKDDLQMEFVAEGFTWQYRPGGRSVDTAAFSKIGPFRAEPTRYWGSNNSELSAKPVFSPDSNWTAYIKNYNVYLRSRKTKEETPLSVDGSATNYYSGGLQWSCPYPLW